MSGPYRDPRYPPFKPPTHATAVAAAEFLRNAGDSDKEAVSRYEADERAWRHREWERAKIREEEAERRWWAAWEADRLRGPYPRPTFDWGSREPPEPLDDARAKAAATLGVHAHANKQEINAAHRKKILAAHPDHATTPEDAATRTQRSAQINAARDTLLENLQ